MKLKITTTSSPILTKKAEPVKTIDKKILRLIADMKDTLNSCIEPVGVGLAAPQVGVSLQIFIIKPRVNSKIEVFINPKIISKNEAQKKDKGLLEGCLSIENIWANIKRISEVEIEYTDINNQKVVKKYSGYVAQIVQHEMDHLEGILFTHRAIQQNEELFKIEKEDGKDVLMPIEI